MASARLSSQLLLPFFFFWPHQAACGILVPQPAMAPTPPALKAWSLNHWTAREVSLRYLKKKKLFLAVLDLPGCVGFSLVVASGGCSLLGVHGLLIAVASLVASHRLDSGGHRLICSEACGIAPDQGSNLSLLHCQADFFFFFNH